MRKPPPQKLRTKFNTETVTIILQGTVDHPTAEDMERVQAIRDELASKHDRGKIIHQSSRRSGYRQLKISWVSKPKLLPENHER